MKDKDERNPTQIAAGRYGWPLFKEWVAKLRTVSPDKRVNAFFESKIIPLREEYGDKPFDIRFSFSHHLFTRKFPKAKWTGLYIDKKGNIIANINVIIKIMIETRPDVWKTAREMFATAIGKVNIDFNRTDPANKTFSMSI